MSDHRDRPTRSGTKAQATAPTASRWPWPLHRKQKPRKTLWESIRETFDSILIALVLASIFRTYVMEAFEIPTGSMAPTLFGRHVDVTCPSCGYTFSVGLDRQGNPTGPLPHEIVCPMCGSRQYIEEPGLVARDADILDPRTLRITGGDRILVDKGSYTLNNPKRWDVGVFVNPHNHSDNYIKRIVGLPGDTLRIRNGDLFVNGHIAPKPDAVQAVLWMPAFNSNFPPEGSWERPWPGRVRLADLTEHSARSDDGRDVWIPPWWTVKPADAPKWSLAGKTFAFTPDRGDTEPSMIRYAWKVRDTYGYGQRSWRGGDFDTLERVGDVRLRAMVTLDSPGLVLATIVEDDHRIDYVLSAEGETPSTVSINGERVLQTAGGEPLMVAGRPTVVTFVNVDDRAWLEVDGRRALGVADYAGRFPLPGDAETERRKEIRLGTAGTAVRFADIRIDRDIYYTATMQRDKAFAVATPLALGPDEYFVLGDHSPRSSDGRRWWKYVDADPQQAIVPRDHFVGKAHVLYWSHLKKLWRIKFIR